MRILTTGSTGFTGKCLLPMLEESGYEIYHLVRNKKEFKNEFVWDFISPLPEEVPPCDVVIHLAAIVGDPACQKTPEFSRQTNWDVSVSLFKESRKRN